MRGAWVAQSVKRLALGFSSGHDLLVGRSSPASGSLLSKESASPLLLPLQLVLSLSNKYVLGAWVVQLVECLRLAQVMIPRVLGSSPASGSLISGDSASPSPPYSHSLMRAISVCLSLK